mmetsp:Transcript_2520/g.3473  ORF Transcript_2520/g.3473 Transcript_2520/m.3473 type:complete len:169 (+) Transcript_2520:29-535(+)
MNMLPYDKKNRDINEYLVKGEELLASGYPLEARDQFFTLRELLSKLNEDDYEMAASCEHQIGIASQQVFQMKKASMHYEAAWTLCAKLQDAGEGSALKRRVLVSLANCRQGPMQNTQGAEQARALLMSLTGYESTTECYICLEECLPGEPCWVMPCARFYHLPCIRRP